MIAPLYKISVICLNEDKRKVTDIILKSEKVHIERSGEHSLKDESVSLVEKQRQNQEEALEILDKYAPEKRPFFSISKPYAPYIGVNCDKSSEIIFLENRISENMAKIFENENAVRLLTPFKRLDLPLKSGCTKNTKYGIFTTEKAVTGEYLKNNLEGIYTEIIFSSKDKSAIFVIYARESADKTEIKLEKAGFKKTTLNSSYAPKKETVSLNKEIERLKTEIKDCEEKIKGLSKERDNIKLLSDINQIKKETSKVMEMGSQTQSLFITEGFIAKKDAAMLKEQIEREAICYVQLHEPNKGEPVPVLFDNNSFSSPVEEITRTYAIPSKKDIDPNSIMAVFYYVFFGMMFSDAGYGLLVSLFCGYMAFLSNAQRKTKNLMRLFLYCGISTFFWGLMFGSFFGDALSVISSTFLGKNYALKPLWIDPTKEPLVLLIFSVGLGILQILTGMGIRFYTLFRQGEFEEAFFDVGSWILILLGVVLCAAGAALKIKFINITGIALIITGAITIILMKGREKKNTALRLFSGVLGLYDITSLVSDSLSYSRLMALGLSTGVIASVVNMMGSLSGGGILGAVIFTVVFILGHSLNFAINMLGAYVHTNRLQYVEFFSKFYQGGGKAFTPLGFNTKYYEFSDRKD